MSAIFAIQVHTGKELEAKQALLHKLKSYGLEMIKDIIAFEVFTKRFRGTDSSPIRVKSAVRGYIFVELEDNIIDIKNQAGEIWHFIRSVPFVQRILNYCITDNQFTRFFQQVQERNQDNLCVSVETAQEQELEGTISHKINTARTVQEKIHWLTLLKDLAKSSLLVTRLNNLKRKIRPFSTATIGLTQEQKKTILFIRHTIWKAHGIHKTIFEFPGQVFLETRKKIDPSNSIRNNTLTNGQFIVPLMINTLEDMFRKSFS